MQDVILPNTFARRGRDSKIFEKWLACSGIWESDDGRLQVVLAPRLPRRRIDAEHGTLSGFSSAGVFHFSDESAGVFYRANGMLSRCDAKLKILDRHLSPIRGFRRGKVLLEFEGRGVELRLKHEIDDARLSNVCIVGHRGLSIDVSLENVERAFEMAWFFGCSGIEFDITVPYEPESKKKLFDRAVVYHPPLDYHSASVNEIPKVNSTPARVFSRLKEYNIPYIYLDPKITGMTVDEARILLESLINGVNPAIDGQLVTAGAPIDSAGEVLANGGSWTGFPAWQSGNLAWTIELTEWDQWTDKVNPLKFFASMKVPPAIFSFSLLRIAESHKWPWIINWLFKDLPTRQERRFRKLSQALIFWTANNEDHFKGSLKAARRMGKKIESQKIGIMTDFPHRLACWLARG